MGSLIKRLDRAVCNDEWLAHFTDSRVLHLPKVASDHRPVLVRFNREERNKSGKRPFHFLAAWLTYSGFSDLVAETWNSDASYIQAARHFIEKISIWNKDHFGNIFRRKRRILARFGVSKKCLKATILGALFVLRSN